MRAFNRFYTSVIGVLDKSFLDSPYSLTEVRILYEIFHNKEPNARQIMEIIHIDEGYLSRTLSKLEKAGLIKKTKARFDSRTNLLQLTLRGEQELSALDLSSATSMQTLIRHLNPEEQEELIVHMNRIQQLLSKTPAHDIAGNRDKSHSDSR